MRKSLKRILPQQKQKKKNRKKQYLLLYLNIRQHLFHTDIEVTVLGNSKVYRDVTPEYIVERVKQCYTFGVLHEEKY